MLWCGLLFAQPATSDTVLVASIIPDSVNVQKLHSPKKASILSAILPGAGQIYNKQYWKVPIVWGAIGISASQLVSSLKSFNEAKRGYILAADTIVGNELPQFSNYTLGDLQRRTDLFRRNRDLSYACVAIFYLLNIVDASVGAHLFYFNVSEDISMNVQPYQPLSTQPSYGLRLTMNF